MPEDSRKTVLHPWHVAHDAKMVDFAGWDMPVRYKAGAIEEHLLTRRHAGLFDVSHMGRFLVEGREGEAFLMRALSNSSCALGEGEAQYTFIPNEAGGAIDDAYLYRLSGERFLLVVNASNREKDWDWLQSLKEAFDCELQDVSEDLAMVSLQGPEASSVLEKIVPAHELPENKRNRLSTAGFKGAEVIVSRTGYTGESVCFELFVPSDAAIQFWEGLIAAGAEAAGLGARDSLRLEAGLPLYGHELGEDLDGIEIPIFANLIAPAGVRTFEGPGPECIGAAALAAQRREFNQIRRGELGKPLADRLLKRLIQPIAAFEGKRPLRQGYKVFLDGLEIGVVTSGTSVPSSAFAGSGLTAKPVENHDLRPIGLALINSDISYKRKDPVILEVEDPRGNRIEVELAERNLWALAPYSRPYGGFRRERSIPGLRDGKDFDHAARQLAGESLANHAWRRKDCINLIPSEQVTSPLVDKLSISDPASRYNEHNRLKALGAAAEDVRYYKGTAFIMEKERELQAALSLFFGCNRVETRVVSGQMANDTVYDALKQFRNRYRRTNNPRNLGPVLVHDLNKGGHLSAQVSGALKNYVSIDETTARPAVLNFPISSENPYRIDVGGTKELLSKHRPDLIVFGRSVIIEKEPVREVASFVHERFGKDNPERPIILYDGAHVLGLLGEAFQDPLAEGADLVTGSTHKTFFGPQRGVILGSIEIGSPFEDLWNFIEQRAFPGHVSNHHLGTLLGLLGATYEMLAAKEHYPSQVVANAKAFAESLQNMDLQVEGDPSLSFTQTHQVLLRTGRSSGEEASSLLEDNNIITNPQAFHDDPSFAAASGIRMGTQEMTRYGMKEEDFANLAGLLAEILKDGGEKPKGYFRETVTDFRSRFLRMQYCL
ncbi:MAG: glycine cleavage system aminomethyltransferase GcvT [Kiloniellales bacterium]|nr:glycine cleavage system aminomethyltransferase GcvT [Kiloniellales bacterium]